jgi:hypothetical protein
MQVREPVVLHESHVVGVLGERARGHIRHIDQHSPRDGSQHDEDEERDKDRHHSDTA